MLRKKTLSFFPKILPPFPIHYISLFSHSGIAQKNHYELLGVTRSATQDDIKLVYYDLARKHHPDINKGDEELFKAINSAYETLSDASKRKEYDEVLRRTSYLTPRKSQPNSSGFRGESKEDDEEFKQEIKSTKPTLVAIIVAAAVFTSAMAVLFVSKTP